MRSNEAMRKMMEERGISQKELQARMGLKSQSSITQFLKSDLRGETLSTIADVLGYEVVIRNKESGEEWKLGEEKLDDLLD